MSENSGAAAPAQVSTESTPGLLPARMLNEFAYCPRLCYLEWVQGEFAENVDVVEGRIHHRTVDKGRQGNCDGVETTNRDAAGRTCTA